MKTIILCLFALVSGVNAQAAPVEKVETSSLQLLGKGVMNRKTSETLAIACFEQCRVLRMVYFTSNGSASYLIGPSYTLVQQGETPTADEIKGKLKELAKRFRKIQGSQPGVVYGKMFATTGLAIGAGLLAVAGVITLPVAFVGAVGLWVGGVKMTMNSTAVFQYDSVKADFSSTDGWNWSSRPKKISNRTFQLLLQSSDADLDQLSQIRE